jgi:tritrans,polycis-undecaprenyl-diphosphate synthase [geranylgeranyl-diphosphate specific]
MNPPPPNHIAIILDGNRRYAKRLMMNPWEGHRVGMNRLKELFQWIYDLGVKELTLYCFSMQNFNRPKPEFDFLMDIFEKAFLEAYSDPRTDERQIRFRCIGRIQLLPKKVQSALFKLTDKTKSYAGPTVNLCLAYGGREELIDAMNLMLKNPPQEITPDEFRKFLYFDSEPDIIVRTGGEKRTSNFLPWQAVYSEWFFLDKTWPEFTEEDLKNIIEEYYQRERRFGK